MPLGKGKAIMMCEADCFFLDRRVRTRDQGCLSMMGVCYSQKQLRGHKTSDTALLSSVEKAVHQ
jgi:hypothetical protein